MNDAPEETVTLDEAIERKKQELGAYGQAMTVEQVINRCNLAAQTMSLKNPNRLLILNLGRGIGELASRLDDTLRDNAHLRGEVDRLTDALAKATTPRSRIALV